MFHHMTMVHTTSALNRPDQCRRKSKSSSLAVETGSLERLPVHSKRTSSSDSSSIDSLEVVVPKEEEDDDILEDPKNVVNEESDEDVSVLEPSLSDSWSVDMFPKKDASSKKYFKSTARGNLIDHYSFRVVRNSEPQSALYLHGEEIFASIEAVWEVHPEATFFIYGRGPPVPISFDVRSRLRSILYRTMWQLEFSAFPYRSSSDATQRSGSSLPSSRRSSRHRLLWLDLCDAPKNQSASRRNKAPHWII